MTKVVAIHTAMALVEPLNKLFREHLPSVKLNHIADDSLIQEVIANNGVTPAVRRRLLTYYQAAVDAGADILFNCCSSVGDVADMGRLLSAVPLFRIDYPMAVEAVTRAKRIGVVATLPTTLAPTRRLLERLASESGKDIELVDALADGAFQAAQAGRVDEHDHRIMEAAMGIADKVDVLVLAQGSMARMQEELHRVTGVTVLSSPESGVLGLKEYLTQKGLLELTV